MSKENEHKHYYTSLYEKIVGAITERVKPRLHKVTEEFVEKSIETYAKDKPKFARMIEFEIKRRGDGAGLTQDVAEPVLWTGIKTAAALAIAALSESLKNKKVQIVGYAAAVGIILNNVVELFRVLPRYKAGLQGSLEMAKDRWRSLQETGVDPFVQREDREIVKPTPPASQTTLSEQKHRDWSGRVSENTNTPKDTIVR